MILKFSSRYNSNDNWNLTKEQEILQNVSNLINLIFTELPLNRQVGVSREFLHERPSVAQLKAFKEIERNIKNYEPRVKINSIDFKGVNESGEMDFVIDLDLKEV